MLELSKHGSKIAGELFLFGTDRIIENKLVGIIDKGKMYTKPKKPEEAYETFSKMLIKIINKKSSDFSINGEALKEKTSGEKVADFFIYPFALIKDKRKRKTVKYKIYQIYFLKDQKTSFLAISDEEIINSEIVNALLKEYDLGTVTDKAFENLMELSGFIKKKFGRAVFLVGKTDKKLPNEQKGGNITPVHSIKNEAADNGECSNSNVQEVALKNNDNIYDSLQALLNISSPLNGLYIMGYYLYSCVYEYINKNNRFALNIRTEKQSQELLKATISLHQEIFFGNSKKKTYNISNISDKKILDKISKNENCAFIINCYSDMSKKNTELLLNDIVAKCCKKKGKLSTALILTSIKEIIYKNVMNISCIDFNTENLIEAKKKEESIAASVEKFLGFQIEEFNLFEEVNLSADSLDQQINDISKRIYNNSIKDEAASTIHAVIYVLVQQYFTFLKDNEYITQDECDRLLKTKENFLTVSESFSNDKKDLKTILIQMIYEIFENKGVTCFSKEVKPPFIYEPKKASVKLLCFKNDFAEILTFIQNKEPLIDPSLFKEFKAQYEQLKSHQFDDVWKKLREELKELNLLYTNKDRLDYRINTGSVGETFTAFNITNMAKELESKKG